eukprot:scaffold4347_cov117-Cylindrotheca_fusiformis.AAC.7
MATVTNKPSSLSSSQTSCNGCGEKFSSRNKMFKHLRDTDGACLDKDDYLHFCKYVRQKKQDKVVILFGYLSSPPLIRNGTDAARLLIKAILQWEKQQDGIVDNKDNDIDESNLESLKFSRSYGNDHRGVDIVAQDEGTGAISELMAIRLQPLRKDTTCESFLDGVQRILDDQLACQSAPVPVRILGRQKMDQAKFNAEMDVSHRRIEYLLPIDFLSWSCGDLKSGVEALPSFSENHKNSLTRQEESEFVKPNMEIRSYLHKLKKIMQVLSTQIVQLDMTDKSAVMEKGFSLQKRKTQSSKSIRRKRNKQGEYNGNNNGVEKSDSNDLAKNEGKGLLKRKRFHNFTETVMVPVFSSAHEYLAYRRMDRFYHRACLRFPTIDTSCNKPFFVLSFTGDLFLTGQVLRVLGVFLALGNGLLDTDFVDCVFDESYPHLIPTPPALPMGMMAGEAYYMTWEGKVKAILSPRNTDRYADGFNELKTLRRVKDWQDVIYCEIAKRWLEQGRDEVSGRLLVEKQWTEEILKPWVTVAQKHLQSYRNWKQTKLVTNSSGAAAAEATSKDLDTTSLSLSHGKIDSSVPELYKKVLYHLRQIDESGTWPSTTLKRQLVMVATSNTGAEDAKSESLSIAHMKAKNNKETRSSAYSFSEGQGGASGSFSVGYMPGGINKQPKSNYLFPELVHAAFELETKLFPHRASSTIAINRNAQFRPHTDSGAGAGQSTSLIVGLGTYSGGELMVEGEEHDIRYKAIEFNGWTQRHWTLPFSGERYSLVWFTPKGCEDMRGIDLEISPS